MWTVGTVPDVHGGGVYTVCFAGAAEELTIYGYDGSTAEAFAEAQGYEFVKLSPWGR